MTKDELIKILEDVPGDSELDIYDLRTFTHPEWNINKEQYFNYDTGTPIVTIEIQ